MKKYFIALIVMCLLSCQTYRSVENKVTRIALHEINSNKEFKEIYDSYCKKDLVQVNKRTIDNKANYVYDLVFPIKENQNTDGWWTNKYAIKVTINKDDKVVRLQAGISGLILMTDR